MHSEVALHTPLHHSFFIRVAALWHHPLAALHIPLPLVRDNLNQSLNPFKGSVYCLTDHEMLMAWCMNNEVRCKFRSPPIWRVLIQWFMDGEPLWWLLMWGQFEFPWMDYNGPEYHVSTLLYVMWVTDFESENQPFSAVSVCEQSDPVKSQGVLFLVFSTLGPFSRALIPFYLIVCVECSLASLALTECDTSISLSKWTYCVCLSNHPPCCSRQHWWSNPISQLLLCTWIGCYIIFWNIIENDDFLLPG